MWSSISCGKEMFDIVVQAREGLNTPALTQLFSFVMTLIEHQPFVALDPAPRVAHEGVKHPGSVLSLSSVFSGLLMRGGSRRREICDESLPPGNACWAKWGIR